MATRLRGVAACLTLALAGCNLGGDVPGERLPRFVEPQGPQPRVALVLGSGGPRGFAHIGVLKALEDSGVRPDLIIGSSVGAMVGALYAGGLSARELERRAYDISLLDLFEFRQLTGGLATGTAIQNYVNRCVEGKPIDRLMLPFVAAATRARDGQLALFNAGDTGFAVRASSATPGQFEPVRIGAELYIDGDEASPVPIRVARRLGARVVIAVDVSAYLADTPSGAPREWVVKDERRARQIAAEAPEADILLHPNIGYFAGHTEAYRRNMIAIAEGFTRERLPAIQAALARAGVPADQKVSTARTPAGEASR